MNYYRQIAESKLHNIEMRHNAGEENEYTKAWDALDKAVAELMLKRAEQEEAKEQAKIDITVEEEACKVAEKRIRDMFKGTILER